MIPWHLLLGLFHQLYDIFRIVTHVGISTLNSQVDCPTLPPFPVEVLEWKVVPPVTD